jgi:hypothetical protein
MAEPLPPDLSRLGDEIDRATARRLRLRRRRAERRWRLCATAVAAALALAAFAPGALRNSDRGNPLTLASASAAYRPAACDQPRGATFSAVRPCAAPGTTDASPDRLARRLAIR